MYKRWLGGVNKMDIQVEDPTTISPDHNREIADENRSTANNDFTEIICIIDRSGSMESIRSDAIGGFNRFLKDQQMLPDKARLTMVLFDDQYELIHNGIDIQKVQPLTNQTFVPRGMTALLDAIGRTINEVSARFSEQPLERHPEKVIVSILTDGQENASREFDRKIIREIIIKYTQELHWDFIYLAANQDAFAESRQMGISAENTVMYSSDTNGIDTSYDMISNAVAMKRKYNDIKQWKAEQGLDWKS